MWQFFQPLLSTKIPAAIVSRHAPPQVWIQTGRARSILVTTTTTTTTTKQKTSTNVSKVKWRWQQQKTLH